MKHEQYKSLITERLSKSKLTKGELAIIDITYRISGIDISESRINKLYFHKSENKTIQTELGSIINATEKINARIGLFERFEKGEIDEAEYIKTIKELENFPF